MGFFRLRWEEREVQSNTMMHIAFAFNCVWTIINSSYNFRLSPSSRPFSCPPYLNRLKPQAEKIIAERQAIGHDAVELNRFSSSEYCVRGNCSTKKDLFHVFVDFKKASHTVWHAALWSTMKQYNININFIKVIESLYGKITSAVYNNGSVGKWFGQQ